MRTIVLESPYSGNIERNVFYARLCTLDSIKRGEAPVTPHLLYPTLTKDVEGMMRSGFIHDDSESSPLSRTQAFERIEALRRRLDATVFYVDLGYSGGMTIAKGNCVSGGTAFEERSLPEFERLMKEYDEKYDPPTKLKVKDEVPSSMEEINRIHKERVADTKRDLEIDARYAAYDAIRARPTEEEMRRQFLHECLQEKLEAELKKHKNESSSGYP